MLRLFILIHFDIDQCLFFVLFSSNPSSDHDFHDFHRNMWWTISDHYLNLNRSTGLTLPGDKNNPWASKTGYFTKKHPTKLCFWSHKSHMVVYPVWNAFKLVVVSWRNRFTVTIWNPWFESHFKHVFSCHFKIPRLNLSRGVNHKWTDIKWNKNLGTCRTCNQLEYDRTAIEENCKFQKNGMQLCRFTCRNDKPIYPLERNIIFAQVSDSNYLTHQKPSETLFI